MQEGRFFILKFLYGQEKIKPEGVCVRKLKIKRDEAGNKKG